ncbi:MAG: mechanosensitive ion channel domain-containing protein [Planctomycetota bacterium]
MYAALILQVDSSPDLATETQETVTRWLIGWDHMVAAAERSIPELIGTGVILLLGLVVYLVLSRVIRAAVKTTHLDDAIGVTLRTILRWGATVLTGAAILNHWDVLQNFWAAATAALTLVAVGFVAVWSVLSNVLCSLILLATRTFRVGDHIMLPSESAQGTVREINLIHTTLRDDDGQLFHIPNNLFFQKVVRRKPRKAQGRLFGVLQRITDEPDEMDGLLGDETRGPQPAD